MSNLIGKGGAPGVYIRVEKNGHQKQYGPFRDYRVAYWFNFFGVPGRARGTGEECRRHMGDYTQAEIDDLSECPDCYGYKSIKFLPVRKMPFRASPVKEIESTYAKTLRVVEALDKAGLLKKRDQDPMDGINMWEKLHPRKKSVHP